MGEKKIIDGILGEKIKEMIFANADLVHKSIKVLAEEQKGILQTTPVVLMRLLITRNVLNGIIPRVEEMLKDDQFVAESRLVAAIVAKEAFSSILMEGPASEIAKLRKENQE